MTRVVLHLAVLSLMGIQVVAYAACKDNQCAAWYVYCYEYGCTVKELYDIKPCCCTYNTNQCCELTCKYFHCHKFVGGQEVMCPDAVWREDPRAETGSCHQIGNYGTCF